MKKKPKRILISSLLTTILCVTALALIATLPGGGWWFGTQVQNVSSTTASISFTVYDFASGLLYGLPWGTDATSWKDLSSFSATQMNDGPMYFVGTLTERIGCRDNCSYPNNYPWEGFQLLSRALASNVTTRQAMRWSTDIEYQP